MMSTVFCEGILFPEYFVTGFVLNLIYTCIGMIILIHCFYTFGQNKDTFGETSIQSIFKWVLITSTLISNLMCLSMSISYVACYANLISLSRLLVAASTLMMFISSSILIFSLIIRIYETFDDSVYKISKTFYVALLACESIIMILCIMGFILFTTFFYSNKTVSTIGLYIGVIGILFGLFIWSIVSILFVKKLALLTIECTRTRLSNSPSNSIAMQSRSRTNSIDASATSKTNSKSTAPESKLNEKRKKEHIVSVATKYVVLNACAVMVAFVSTLIMIGLRKQTYNPKVMQIFVNLLTLIGTINFFAVYLQYQFASKVYSKLCFCLDHICYSIIHGYVQMSAGKSISNEKTLACVVSESNDKKITKTTVN
eukprot:509318_1